MRLGAEKPDLFSDLKKRIVLDETWSFHEKDPNVISSFLDKWMNFNHAAGTALAPNAYWRSLIRATCHTDDCTQVKEKKNGNAGNHHYVSLFSFIILINFFVLTNFKCPIIMHLSLPIQCNALGEQMF